MTIRPFVLGVLVLLTLSALSCSPGKEAGITSVGPTGTSEGPAETPAETPSVEPPPPPGPSRAPLEMTFAGDIMAHDVNYNRPPFSNIYEGVRHYLEEDDLSFGNLEFAVVPDWPVSTYPVFNVHPSYVHAAIDGGFDVFSVANNHITDLGEFGVKQTRQTISDIAVDIGTKRGSPTYFSGLRESPDGSFATVEITKKGWRIGFTAVTLFLNTYGGSEYVQLVPYRNDEDRELFLNHLKTIAPSFDLFIVSLHGGTEYAIAPDPEQLEFFKEILRSGAHIVWAHHPHVVQPWYLFRDGTYDKLILASCGNFISGQTWHIEPEKPDPSRVRTGESALFQVTATETEEDELDLTVTAVLFANYRDPEKGMVVRTFDDLLEDDMLSPEWKRFYAARKPELHSVIAPLPIQNLSR
jgi:hypothetical protein